MVKTNYYLGGADVLSVEEVFRNCLNEEMNNKNIEWIENEDGLSDTIPEGVEITLTVVLKKHKRGK